MGLSRRGVTKVEVIVVLVVTLVLVAIAVVVIGQWAGESKRSIGDGMQMSGIHQSWLIFARDYDGQLPTPGAIRRRPIDRDGELVIVPGQGDLDPTQNTTANLFSICIMQNYYGPELCIGMSEPSEKVRVDEDHNWDLYAPAQAIYWDDAFKADLDTESNVSYAHMPLYGERLKRYWSESMTQRIPLIGNRGPEDGDDPDSITIRTHRPYSKWSGYVIGPDNSISMLGSMTYGTIDIDGVSVPDHLFRFDDGPAGADAFLGFTKAMTEDGPVVQWD